jgi:hypothetical protein
MVKRTLLLLAFISVMFAPKVLAQEPVASVSAQRIEYILPYPGILPDHPLYFLKSLRDRILNIAISNPIKKTEFYLLMADKRLAMGELLMEQGKQEIAYSTITKAEKYRAQAVETFIKIKVSQKDNVASLLDKLLAASYKHSEVITRLAQKNPDRATDWEGLLSSLKQSVQELEKLK